MPRTRWPAERLARAVFLAGRGLSAERIAQDVMIGSYAAAVTMHLRTVGIAPRGSAEDAAMLAVPIDTVNALQPLALRRGETPDALASRLLEVFAEDPTLADNVLDDGR